MPSWAFRTGVRKGTITERVSTMLAEEFSIQAMPWCRDRGDDGDGCRQLVRVRASKTMFSLKSRPLTW